MTTTSESSPTSLLVSLLGRELLPIAVQALRLQPRRLLPVSTESTVGRVETLRAVLGEALPGCAVVEALVLGAGTGVLAISDAIQDRILIELESPAAGPGAIRFDVTGGLKPMAIGLTLAGGEHARQLGALVYLQPNGVTMDAAHGDELTHPPGMATLRPTQVARLRGCEVAGVRWEGRLSDDLETALGAREGARASIDARWKRLAAGKGGRGGHGEWLETACLLTAQAAFPKQARSAIAAAWSVTVRPSGGDGIDEVDLVLVRDNRVVVVEAKSGSQRGKSEARKRRAMVDTSFGRAAHVVMVAPQQSESSVANVQRDLGSRRFTMVRTASELAAALRRELGL